MYQIGLLDVHILFLPFGKVQELLIIGQLDNIIWIASFIPLPLIFQNTLFVCIDGTRNRVQSGYLRMERVQIQCPQPYAILRLIYITVK